MLNKIIILRNEKSLESYDMPSENDYGYIASSNIYEMFLVLPE